MKLSSRGMIDIMSHEGICLEPYLDSVGVWTIGIGQTKSDDIDPRLMGKITIKEAVDLFQRKIKQYTDAVDALKLDLTQYQYDALTSLCYNFGPGNLRKLCHNRSIQQIGDAIMLYTKPPEITGRRKKEQALFKQGIYSNLTGKVLVFPVVNNHPRYKDGYQVDVRPFLGITVPLTPPTPKPKPVVTPTKTVAGGVVAAGGTVAAGVQQGWGMTGWGVAAAILALGVIVAILILRRK